jgi:transposase-like protein
VDTSAEQSTSTDSLGRRTGPRRQHTIEEKLRIVRETHVKGASVATVARRHDVNPNQVFAWRQMYRQGLLDPKAPPTNPPMLPVKVSTPTVLPTERAVVSHHPDAPHSEHVKSRFPEMLVRRQHIRNLEFPHDYKTRAISERVPMI